GVLVVEDSMLLYTLAWMRLERGLEEEVTLIRPQEMDELPETEKVGTVVRIPVRSDSPPPEGWRRHGEVWVWEGT
ncbi:MAG: hypothetical protein PF795_06975, partial [Kiritimatiellae bacterium]|nr:hypothetical protein [Kiritimatiellia bacterium]